MINEKIQVSLFNRIITNRDDEILSIHLGDKDKLTPFLDLKHSIQTNFDYWKEKEGNVILATKGENHYLLLYRDYIENDSLLRFYIILNDTNFFELENQLLELDKSNRELDAIIESSYDGIYITDRFGNTLKTNSAIERITGIPKHYYVGKNISHLIKRGILEESVTFKVLEQKKPVSVVQKNFNQKETLMTGSPIFNEDGEIEKVVTNIRDLSDLNQLNSELIKVQKLNEQYREELQRLKSYTHMDPDVIIKSDKMIELFTMIERLANFDTTMLILGETGVGKDVLVRHLFRRSSRCSEGELIKINCGAIPNELLESELFGYEGGAFSGANKTGKAGMFELAHKGMLFLDEIGELPLDLQVKLLRAIQEKEFMRVGGTKIKKIDVRLVAATNKDLKEMVKNGQFREDLYYRLHVVPVMVPPLRERKDDILPLVHYFLESYSKKYNLNKMFDKELNNFFYYYHWPGNVRELSNLLERLILTIQHNLITFADLPDEYKRLNKVYDSVSEQLSLKEAVELAEQTVIKNALRQCKTTYELADILKTSQATIVRKLQKYNMS